MKAQSIVNKYSVTQYNESTLRSKHHPPPSVRLMAIISGGEELQRRLPLSLAACLILSTVVLSVSAARPYGTNQQYYYPEGSDPRRNTLPLIAGVLWLTAVVAAASFFGKMLPFSRRDGDDQFTVAGGSKISQRARRNRRSTLVSSPASSESVPHQLGCGNPASNNETRLPISQVGRAYLREFEYDVLAKATSRFHKTKKLGEGTTGAVFGGSVLGYDGLQTRVAIKRFHNDIGKKMINQVQKDLRDQPLRHRNLVYLLGYCLIKGKLYLVYDLMENGNLEKHLFTGAGASGGLSWAHRVNIVTGVALGLQHLHGNNCVHGSVKANNVFLEQDFTPRLGDFGYSRVVPSKRSSGENKAVVYTPPECLPNSTSPNPTYEVDVFYLGALVLEVVCGRKFCGGDIPNSFGFLVDWVWNLHGGGRILDAVDAALLGGDHSKQDEGRKLLLVALACSHPDPKHRPKMDDVVKMLSGTMPLPEVPPSKPTYLHARNAPIGGPSPAVTAPLHVQT